MSAPLIAVTDTSEPRDPARWDLVSNDISRALGARIEGVQVLSVIRTGGDFLVHVQIECPRVTADGTPTSTEGTAA